MPVRCRLPRGARLFIHHKMQSIEGTTPPGDPAFSLARDLVLVLRPSWSVSGSRPLGDNGIGHRELRDLETVLEGLRDRSELTALAIDELRGVLGTYLADWLGASEAHSWVKRPELVALISADAAAAPSGEHAAVLRRATPGEPREPGGQADAMLWMSGGDGVPARFSQAWLAFRGTTAEAERGMRWAERLHPEDRERWVDAYAHAFAARSPFEMSVRFRGASGAFYPVAATGAPLFTAYGVFDGFAGACTAPGASGG
jgi:PAS domain-containing protein